MSASFSGITLSSELQMQIPHTDYCIYGIADAIRQALPNFSAGH
jgi:hypothetical protein